MTPERTTPPSIERAEVEANRNDHTRCRQINGECYGYHCAHCGKSVGMMGHDCPHGPRPRSALDD